MSRNKHTPFMGWIEVETKSETIPKTMDGEESTAFCWDEEIDDKETDFIEALPPEALSRLAQKAHQRQKAPKPPRQWR